MKKTKLYKYICFPDLWSFGCGYPRAGGSKTELLLLLQLLQFHEDDENILS